MKQYQCTNTFHLKAVPTTVCCFLQTDFNFAVRAVDVTFYCTLPILGFRTALLQWSFKKILITLSEK